MPKIKNKLKRASPKRRKSRHGLGASLHHARFLPAVIVLLLSFTLYLPIMSKNHQSTSVLAYATSMSPGDLLTHTNIERGKVGRSNLVINPKLTAAAQAKANDMANRNYWSHVTPDGEQPWYFILQAGYAYRAAGENLAYGFLNSADAVTGWMNSPSHRENMLQADYQEIGFGIANSSDYVGDGNETIVVAMYGLPYESIAAAPAAPKASTQERAPVQAKPIPMPTATSVSDATQADTAKPLTLDEELAAPVSAAVQPEEINRIELLSSTWAPWSGAAAILMIGAFAVVWAMQRGLHIKRMLVQGEQLFMRHLHVDLFAISLVLLLFVLLQTAGRIH